MARRISILRLFAAALLFSFVFVSHQKARTKLSVNYPPISDFLIKDNQFVMQDISLVLSGFRNVAADMAWVQLLQYTGGAQILGETGSNSLFPNLKSMTLRVMRLDPYFKAPPLFGAGLLGWLNNINRPQEAVELLQEGIHWNPTYWPFHAYLISLGYKNEDQADKMLDELRHIVTHPDCPLLVKAILANTFKRYHRYAEAIAIWMNILATSDDPAYRNRANQQIAQMSGYRNSSSTPPQ